MIVAYNHKHKGTVYKEVEEVAFTAWPPDQDRDNEFFCLDTAEYESPQIQIKSLLSIYVDIAVDRPVGILSLYEENGDYWKHVGVDMAYVYTPRGPVFVSSADLECKPVFKVSEYYQGS